MPVTAGPIYPGIKDGLVFAIDPANKDSWAGPTSATVDSFFPSPLISGSIFNDTSGSYGSNESFSFDGVDDVIIGDLPDNFTSTLPSSGRPHVSISFWMKPTGASNCQVLGFRDQNSGRYIGIRYLPSGGSLRVGCNAASAFGVGFSGITSGEWNHVVAVKERAVYGGGGYQPYDTIKAAYINGSPVSIGASTVNQPTTSKMIIGRIAETGLGYYGGNFEGSIGPILLYHKELSASEVLQNYNRLKGRFGLS